MNRISLNICFTVATMLGVSIGDEPVPPAVKPASSEGQVAINGFKVPAGWQATLVAAEPKVANVVAFDIDGQGTFWVCETFRQDNAVTDNRAHDETWLRADLAAMTVEDRVAYHKRLLGDSVLTLTQQDDRIRRLRDSTGDGLLDQSVVFANGFNRIEEGTGAGVLSYRGEVFYTCIPNLWKLKDADSDGRSDSRDSLASGFGVRVAFRGHDMHGLVRGPDGRLYFSIGDRGYNVRTREGKHLFDPASGAVFRCEMDGSELEVYATGLRNPQELAFDKYGNLFTADNNSDSGDKARWVYVVEGGDTGWRMSYQYFPDRGPFNREKIWHPLHHEQPAYIVPPIANISDGPSGLAYYPGTGLSEDWDGRFLLADFRGTSATSGIRTFRVKPQGAFFELVDDEEPIWSILATDVAFGPDGAIYVSDWVDGWVGEGKGRIYRFADPAGLQRASVHGTRALLAGDWTTREDRELIQLLGHQDQRVRLESQWALADRSRVALLREVIQNPSLSTVHRLHGAWGLGQIQRREGLDPDTIQAIDRLLDDGDPNLRCAASDLLGAIGDTQFCRHLMRALSDADATVRYHSAMALARHKHQPAFDSIVRLLDENDNKDPILRHGGVMALAQIGTADQIADLQRHPSVSVRRGAVVALRRQASERVSDYLQDRDPLVVLEAARAINDVPINAAMSALAEMIDRPAEDDALMRRVLNANFRLGRESNLKALVHYAASNRNAESLRIEALEMLLEWRQPDERDRVMNLWRPLKVRPGADVAGALRRELPRLLSARKPIARRTIRLAADNDMVEIVPQLDAMARDASVPALSRREAMIALARLDETSAESLASVMRRDRDVAMRTGALEVLHRLQVSNLVSILRDATGSSNMAERQLAWDLLAAHDSSDVQPIVEQGIRDYIAGRLPKDVWLNVLEASKTRIGESLARDLRRATDRWGEEDPMATYRATLYGGNVEAGEKLFYEKTELSCVRCHRVHRRGGQVGPVLTTIGAQRDRVYLLESLVFPDAKIAKGFETAVIADDFGQVVTGIVREETPESVRLVKSDGTEVRIMTDEIIVRRRGKSAMPEDLVKQMSHREIRDLVAFLETLKVDPRAVQDDTE